MSSAKEASPARLINSAGLSVEFNANGSLRRIDLDATLINLFPGNEVEGGPANLYLRRLPSLDLVPLLGPMSATRFRADHGRCAILGVGDWNGLEYSIELRLAADEPAWFWHVRVKNRTTSTQRIELVYVQDLALAPYAAVRLNEYYVSQYVDHVALEHHERGIVIASRQNQPVAGRHPWSVIGSLRRSVSYATDALQLYGVAARADGPPVGLVNRLSGRRLQHEHSMVVLQDDAVDLASQAVLEGGFFARIVPHHPDATSRADLAHVDSVLSLPEASPGAPLPIDALTAPARSLFKTAPSLVALDLTSADLLGLFGPERRHEEFDAHGRLLSFFAGTACHVVLRAKELRVERPHGHLLHTGRAATPDEHALTSTVWMNGVFNSMLTQGHVSFNRFLTTVRSYLGLFRSQGQRIFVELHGHWQLLDMPSAFEIEPDACRWIYRHADGLIEVRTQAHSDPHAIGLALKVLVGEPVRFLIVHHVALNGDDGTTRQPVQIERRGEEILVKPAPRTELAERFPGGVFALVPQTGTTFEQVGGDEMVFSDRQSRHEPYVCVSTPRTTAAALRIVGRLVGDSPDVPSATEPGPALEHLLLTPPVASPLAEHVERIADIIPWLTHNAFIHYLAPRGLEQYSGGGWGTRDVTQGPVELLLATGRTAPIRDLLLRVMRAQKSDGDWPQWFMFFERDRNVRAGDSHGDIVFWPVLALAQYLVASGDAKLLDERVAFFDASSSAVPTVWQHVERALQLIEQRLISGTTLVAYGHGDWNDALQPADSAMREHMCSAWTVTLHHQTLTTLARAMRSIGRSAEASRYEQWAEAVRRDFQRLLVVDGVLTGYALFESGRVRYLLHPRDDVSGVRYSSLAMIHALLEGLFTPEQAREHLQLMEAHLLGPDGMRLFDRPMSYHGGPQRFFQRAESATFFGREIGLMYMHAHLRYAQALAHVGEADRFFAALCRANPIGIRSVVPQATLRQANCYYSSSDAAFADRYQASAEYHRIKLGTVGLDGGWRVYSSGAGIALGLIVRHFLGLSLEADALSVDPVIPAALNGMHVELQLLGKPVEIEYSIRGTGCGVSAIAINGVNVPFAREANPYRVGAARIPLREVHKMLRESGNTVSIAVGSL